MKAFLMSALVVMALAVPVMAEMAKNEAGAMPPLEAKSPATLAIFYADWCSKCKILDPKMKDAMASLSKDDKSKLKVVMFDLSDEAKKAESAALAGRHGLTDLFQYYAPKTGFAVLYREEVDLAAQEKLMSDDTVEGLQEKIEVYVHDQTKMNG